MKMKLSIWSASIGLLAIILILNLIGVVHVDPWGIFGLVTVIFCLFLIWNIFIRKK